MFSFDADNKLEGAEYDALGNLTRYEAMSLSMGYSFGGLKSFGSNNTVDLDPYGQIQSIETVPGTWSVVFTPLTDTPGLLEMRAPGGKEWTYAILPNGQILYGKEADGSICIFLPDAAGNVVAETNGEGGYTHEQLFTVHLDRVGGEWGDVPLGAGGLYGGITMINGEGEDGVEIVIEDGGKKVTVPEAKRRASSEDPTPGFPNGSDPLKENTEATSGVVNLDNILEAMDQHLGGGLIQRDQDPEDKGEQVAPSPEEVKRSTTTIEPGPSLRGLRGVDYLKKLEFYYFDPGYKYEDEENRGFDRGAYALDDGVLKLPADVDPSKLSVDEKIEVVQTLTQDFTRTPYDKLIDILFPEKNAAPNSTARDQNGAKREQKGALVIERSAVGVEVRPNTNTPNVK